MNELNRTKEWFEQAIPEPTDEQKCVQIGCHIEEFTEMMAVFLEEETGILQHLADKYKSKEKYTLLGVTNIEYFEKDRKELLDALVDQIVTATGVGHVMGLDVLGALAEVNRSNFSKFEDGKPVFDKNGKITKGKNYIPPKLDDFV